MEIYKKYKKLQTILLLKADFNTLDELFNSYLISLLEVLQSIASKTIQERKTQTDIYLILKQSLLYT